MISPVAVDNPDAEADRIAALNAAAGAGVSQDWTVAIEYLRRAAKLGSRLALAELAALSCDWEAAHRLLAGEELPPSCTDPISTPIDLTKWLELPQVATVSESPRLVGVAELASEEFCKWVIARARRKLSPAGILDRATGERYIQPSVRTNTVCDFRGAEGDILLAVLRARIAALTGTRVEAFESVHVLHYGVGEEFRPHLDATLDSRRADYSAKYAAGQQRVLTFLLALNDDFEGGETDFPVIGRRWKPRRGRGIFFWNVHPDGTVDHGTFHAGRPVLRGEKWMLSQWVAGRRPKE